MRTEPSSAASAIFAANRAQGSVRFDVHQVEGVTRRRQLHESGSLRVRFPSPEAEGLSAVFVNTAGGIAGGDRFETRLPHVGGTGHARTMESDYEAMADDLVARGATRAQMMGRPILKVGSTMFAAHVGGDRLAVKLGRDTASFAEALALPGAAVWSPGDSGRLFHDWVALPSSLEDEWMRFAEVARVAAAQTSLAIQSERKSPAKSKKGTTGR